MLQEEDYDSDTSDEDFVPNEVKESEDDASSDEKDSDKDEVSEGDKPKKGKKKGCNKRKKGNPLLAQVEPTLENNDEELEESKEEKKKEEDVWADFLADVEEKKEPVVTSKPKGKSWAELLGKKKPKQSNSSANTDKSNSSATTAAAAAVKSTSSDKMTDSNPGTVKITKVFEFAGEEVRVEEEVAADSNEAKVAEAQNQLSSQSSVSGPVKRGSNLAGLVGALGNKKQKLSTLEKTKLDWQNYKEKEGIKEELTLHTKSKDTYLDKQEFLQRTDVRQFEIERSIRMGSRRSNR